MKQKLMAGVLFSLGIVASSDISADSSVEEIFEVEQSVPVKFIKKTMKVACLHHYNDEGEHNFSSLYFEESDREIVTEYQKKEKDGGLGLTEQLLPTGARCSKITKNENKFFNNAFVFSDAFDPDAPTDLDKENAVQSAGGYVDLEIIFYKPFEEDARNTLINHVYEMLRNETTP